jgi:hypothetical protein
MSTAAQEADDRELTRDEWLEELGVRLDGKEATMLRTVEAAARARHALNGAFAGRELDNRLQAMNAAVQAQHAAVDEWIYAKAALAAAEQQEG